ncbi:hypothetical protein PHYSODRAFT_286170, partial [Phytophthora sojae]
MVLLHLLGLSHGLLAALLVVLALTLELFKARILLIFLRPTHAVAVLQGQRPAVLQRLGPWRCGSGITEAQTEV